MVPPLPVAFVLSVVGANLFYINQVLPAELPEKLFSEVEASELTGAAFINDSNLAGLEPADSQEEAIGYVLVERSSFLNPSLLSTNITPSRNGLLTYEVGEGDTVSTIAAEFGISVNTIIWANELAVSGKIKPGEEIIILPVSGVLHKVAKGESINSIAQFYGIEAERISTLNKDTLKAGDTVVVPNARPISYNPETDKKEGKNKKLSFGSPPETSLTSSGGYFTSPVVSGLNWGKLHDGNAVDIAAACGTPIVAAASGVVTETGSPGNWNSGYGGFVRISHANGTVTFYGHNSVNLVGAGDQIGQGSVIAKIGRTGQVRGITGCHVHFGVSGARNPFAR
ncbi:MAG: M23 family metallopeptidase [Candidatus Colwellbacteria bacterium]|nr:M23 family metallopeptidase [Candidatus Colwellbacteria bacterium]